MNEKEKAGDIFGKYFSEMRMPSDCEGCMQCIDRCENMVAVAKKYALICVDEILNQFVSIHNKFKEAKIIDGDVKESANYIYWIEVKQEIKLL